MKKVITIFFVLSLAWSSFSTDFSYLAMSARPMGMGNTFAAIADDVSALTFNPAGFGHRVRNEVQVFNTKLLGDVDLISLSTAWKQENGAVGLGYIQASVSGIPLTTLDANNRPEVLKDVTYADTTWSACYGFEANGLAALPGRLFFGISGKYFNKGISGLSNLGSGSGFNFDLGCLYEMDRQWQFGLVRKNVISTPALGSIVWTTGAVDQLPSSYIVGLRYNANSNWLLAADYDLSTTWERKGLLHLGTEYLLTSYFFLRGGWQQLQDSVGSTTYGSPTVGLSLLMQDLALDYAYQPVSDINYQTHFISLRYAFQTTFLAPNSSSKMTINATITKPETKPVVAPELSRELEDSDDIEIIEVD